MSSPGFNAENALGKALYSYRAAMMGERGWLQPVVFRVFDPDGNPLHGAEVRVGGGRCQTVNGMCQTYVRCDGKLKKVEVWSVWGILRRSFWAAHKGSWLCNKT